MKKNWHTLSSFFYRYRKSILSILGIGLVFAIWWLLSLRYHNLAIPSPGETFKQVYVLLGQKQTYVDIFSSLIRLFIAFSISFLIGSLLGILAGIYSWVYRFLRPLIITLRTLPTAAVILVFVTVMSSKEAPYYIVFLVVFPLVYEAMANGLKNIPNELMLSLKLEGKNSLRSIFKIRIPLAAPYILLGILQSLGLGMKVEIMSEILSGNMNLNGLGIAIKVFLRDVEMVNVFAYSVITIVIMGLIEGGLYLAKKRIKKN